MNARMKDRLTALFGIALLLVLVASSYYYSIKAGLESLKAEVSPQSPDYTAQNFTVTEFLPDGRMKRRVYADYAEHYADGRIRARRPRLATLLTDKPQIRMSADIGKSEDDGETLYFEGNVLVTRAEDEKYKPMQFTSPHATVYPDTSRVETDTQVEMKSQGDTTTGIGLKLDNVEQTVVIFSRVRTLAYPKGTEESSIRRK